MDCSPRGVRGPRLALLGACAGVFVLLAACGSSGEPADYDSAKENDAAATGVAAASGATPTGYNAFVEENFMRSCERSAELLGSDPGPVTRQYCICTWDRIVNEIPFEDFRAVEGYLLGTGESIDGDDGATAVVGPALLDIIGDCLARHVPSSVGYTAFVEANFKQSCEASFNDPTFRPVADQVCACAWDEIVAEIPFEDFAALDEALRNDPEAIRDPAAAPTVRALAAINASCIARYSPN